MRTVTSIRIVIALIMLVGFVALIASLKGFFDEQPIPTGPPVTEPPSTDPLLSTFTPTLPVIFQAVAKEILSCYVTTPSGQILVTVVIPQYGIVDVVGKNNNDAWILIRFEGLPECWVELSSLNLNGDVSSLTVISNSIPPTLDISSTPEFGASALDVDVSMDIVQCACDGKPGEVLVTLNIKNGEPPYDVNGQGPVTRNTITFRLALGSRASLTVTSSDGKKWEGIVIAPIQCSPLPNSCTNPGDPNPQPTSPPNPQSTNTTKPACSDGKDNDNDGFVDYLSDNGCDSPEDNHE